MSGQSLDTDKVQAYLEAAQKHAEARVRYSYAWQIAYNISKNDWQATQAAIDRTKDEVTLTKAALKVAEERMVRE